MTGWVSISDAVSFSGFYQLIWEVGRGLDPKELVGALDATTSGSWQLALRLRVGHSGGFKRGHRLGTSGALDGHRRVRKSSAELDPNAGLDFAFLDISGGITPIYTLSILTSDRGSTRRSSKPDRGEP